MSTLEKHFFNDPDHLVKSSLRSLTLTNPALAFDEVNKIIYRRPRSGANGQRKVSIISGGGSGHEPGIAGFVGKGLLTAAVAGTIFASPSAEQVRQAIMTKIPTEQGVLVITMNYTGDALNFGMAAEKAKARGIKTEFYAIGDDVGVGRAKSGKVGRRGIAGTILVLKIIGAAAELGCSLDEVYGLAKQVANNVVSVGASMEHVHVPGRSAMESLMPMGDVEIGMGIHNEPGSQTTRATLPELVSTMLSQLLSPSDKDRNYVDFVSNDSVVLLINNLGGVSMLELGGVVSEVMLQLGDSYKITPVRVISGTFLTSLNGLGFSISLLRLEDTGLGNGMSMLELLDLPAEACGWAVPIHPTTWNIKSVSAVNGIATDSIQTSLESYGLHIDPTHARQVLRAGLDRVIAAEPEVTRYDTITGDGDCGIGLKRGAEAVQDAFNSTSVPTDVVAFVNRIISVVENTMDGTSGAIYAIFLNALAAGLRSRAEAGRTTVDAKVWAASLTAAMNDLRKYTPATEGDRTLMDALIPFVRVLNETGNVRAAAEAAKKGAEKTKSMKASLGRAVYVGGEQEWLDKIPDPGAWGLSEFLNGIAGAC